MKLFLCGGGSGEQILEAYKALKLELNCSKPILYVPLAMDVDKYDSCQEWFANEIKYIGLDQFYMVRSADELAEINFDDYCAIFIGGGNTYKLLKDLKDKNIDKKLLHYLDNNGVVFGGSAGAIIFGKDINICKLEDGNTCKLEDTSGLNLINNCSILCHLNEKHYNRNFKMLINSSFDHKILYLPEEDVIFIEDNKIKTYGDKPFYVFKNGKYYSKPFRCLENELKVNKNIY